MDVPPQRVEATVAERMAPYIEDFEYLMSRFDSNYAIFSALYRISGFNLTQVAQGMREELHERANAETWSFFVFRHFLQNNIFNPIAPYNFQHFFLLTVSMDELYDLFNRETLAYMPNNLQMEILEDGHIAYISIASFFVGYEQEANEGDLLLNFFEEISDFGHLIIDIRNNTGGYPTYYFNNVFAPLVSRHYAIRAYIFASEGTKFLLEEHRYYNPLVEGEYEVNWVGISAVSEIMPLNGFTLPYLNPDDLQFLDYYVYSYIFVNPMFDTPLFDGKIWILINRNNFSAGEHFARVAKEIELGTLVGEPTGGHVGRVWGSFIELPNTGIVVEMDEPYKTDAYGRFFEEIPVVPHIEASDPLQAVLDFIGAGNY